MLVLGGLDKATEFIVYDIGCRVDVLLGYNWLAALDLHFCTGLLLCREGLP